MEPYPTKLILFDLDNTLFDHYHSLNCAISAIQERYPGLADIETQTLIEQYNNSLQQAYDRYLKRFITYKEKDTVKVKLFFQGLGLPEPSSQCVIDFRATYQPAYRASRRATPGSIELLTQLRKLGYVTAIVTNGQTEDQSAKASAIRIRHLVDRIITSEEAGYPKPDRRIFQYAIKQLGGSSDTTYMVGDSVESDIQGALNTNLKAVLYSPISLDTTRSLYGKEVPIISHMNQLLDHLGIRLN
ncbi:hypothetical protein ACLX1H_002907 [Fusarium chlamydosporum]